MKISNFTFLLFALFAFSLASCDKDEAMPTDELDYLLDADADEVVDALVMTTDAETAEAQLNFPTREEGHRFSGDCFTLVYPITLSFPDGNTTTVDDGEALREAVREYLRADRGNRRRGNRPTFVYPISIQLNSGELVEVTSRADFIAQLRQCAPDVTPCYSLIYPVKVDLGGDIASAEDAAELRVAVAIYRKANPGAELPKLVYPVSVETRLGDTITVESRATFVRLRRECRPAVSPCFVFDYPVALEHRSAGVIEVTTPQQLRRALSHANRRGRWKIVYPTTVIQDGELIEIASLAELRALRRDCR